MIDKDDLEKIKARDPAFEIKCLYDGCDFSEGELKAWKWQKKYEIKFSIPIKPEEIEAAYGRGMLRKEELKGGEYYWGTCRNARVARWSSKYQLFFHQRKKGCWYVESIPHPVGEETEELFGKIVGFDVFVPWVAVTPLDFERVDAFPEPR